MSKDSFFESLLRDIELQGIVQTSMDSRGKPDPWKAAGMAVGLGRTALSDLEKLGALLGSQGAFDGEP